MSTRTPLPPGRCICVMVPGEGMKFFSGVSALMRHSMACPCSCTSSCENDSGSPAATRIISPTRSVCVTISVTQCSTWMRVFISMK